MRRVPVHRLAEIPDRLRLERYRRTPELGPRLLFFSGGSALKGLSQELKTYSHNTIHLVTPFDSGGSSEALRRAFHMPSVGDLRSRLLSLADDRLAGNREIVTLFSERLSTTDDTIVLKERLQDLVNGRDPLMASVPAAIALILRSHLAAFAEAMPEDFDLRGASLGNLALTGGYLVQERDIDSVTYLYTRLLEVRGQVRCVVDAHLDLGSRLRDGTFLKRQHLLTAKEAPAIESAVSTISLLDRRRDDAPAEIGVSREIGEAIVGADLIVYPMGSFYSSIAANLLPRGVGPSVMRAGCPRVYVPSSDRDPEMLGLSLGAAVEKIVSLIKSEEKPTSAESAVDLVLIDTKHGHYPDGLELDRIQALGARVIDLELGTPQSSPRLDGARLAAALLSIS